MKLTNKHNLPDAIYRAAGDQQAEYQAGRGDGDISVTTLIGPPQINQLMKIHGENITEDVSDRLWAIMGTAMHNILESAETKAKVEERLYAEFEGWKVSGKYDRMLVEDGVLQDYKFASVWEYIYGLKQERVDQLNCLAELATQNGYQVNALQVVMMFRDWSATKAKHDPAYPQSQVALIDVKLWEQSKRVRYIEDRVRLHKAAANGDTIHCTDEERWANGHKWAVMKKGRKSALKVADSEIAAQNFMMEKGISDADGVHYVEFRKGEYKRCTGYCPVAEFCQQFKYDN